MTSLRKPGSVALALQLLLCNSVPVWADGGDQMGFTTYYFSDSGQNTVATTSFNLAKRILDWTVLLIDIELDNVTVPPITAITGATRPQRDVTEAYEKSRGQIILGVEQGLTSNSSLAVSGYRSQEVDYVSSSGIATFSAEMFDKNMTITGRGQYQANDVGEIRPDGSLAWEDNTIYNGQLFLTQLLSPTTILDLSYDASVMKGFLSDPYRLVSVKPRSDSAAVVTKELHPDYRNRHGAYGKISQMIPGIRASIFGAYRYYFDSWEVKSSTIELRFNKYVVNDVIFGIDYRYYNQTAAFFYQQEYAGREYLADAYRTADYKLKPFSSNSFGFSLTWLLRSLGKDNPDMEFLRNSSIEFMYFRYFNTQDFSADILQAGLKFSI